jgi:Zn ribbon nucleic-acid-binding protein
MSKKQDKKIRNIIYEIYGIKDVCPYCGSADTKQLLPTNQIGIFMPVKKCNDCQHEWFYKRELDNDQQDQDK